MMSFTGLVQMDDNLQVQPQMAKYYDTSPDGQHRRYTLRDGDARSGLVVTHDCCG